MSPATAHGPANGRTGAERPMVEAHHVRKSFGRLEVLKGIDLEVPRGTVTCLIGPSGSGKSTLLRCVNHLEQVNAGRLYVDGELIGYRERDGVLHEISPRDAARQRADIGMVFQNFNLFPHRTVLGNIIEAPMHVKGVKQDAATDRAMELLNQVGLAHKADAYPVQLSGGQQQRVAIGRALMNSPAVLLADEPTGNLDSRTSAEIMAILRDANKRLGQTLVVITHDESIALTADRIVAVEDGRIVRDEAIR